jgi:hypothetical protein
VSLTDRHQARAPGAVRRAARLPRGQPSTVGQPAGLVAHRRPTRTAHRRRRCPARAPRRSRGGLAGGRRRSPGPVGQTVRLSPCSDHRARPDCRLHPRSGGRAQERAGPGHRGRARGPGSSVAAYGGRGLCGPSGDEWPRFRRPGLGHAGLHVSALRAPACMASALSAPRSASKPSMPRSRAPSRGDRPAKTKPRPPAPGDRWRCVQPAQTGALSPGVDNWAPAPSCARRWRVPVRPSVAQLEAGRNAVATLVLEGTSTRALARVR